MSLNHLFESPFSGMEWKMEQLLLESATYTDTHLINLVTLTKTFEFDVDVLFF